MENSIIIGLIGTGKWALEAHLPILKSTNLVKQVYIFDPNFSEIVHDKKVTVCDNVDDLFNSNLDGLIISTPNEFHYKYAHKALERGIHVHIDKPISENLEDVVELINFSKQKHLIISTHTQKKYCEGVTLLKECLEKYFRKLYHVSGTVWQKQFQDFENSWRSNNTTGILMDSGFHILDTILSVLTLEHYSTPPSHIHAIANNANNKNDAFTSLHFLVSEIAVQVNAFRGVPALLGKEEYQFFGDAGFIRLIYTPIENGKIFEFQYINYEGVTVIETSKKMSQSLKSLPTKLFINALNRDKQALNSVLESTNTSLSVIEILDKVYPLINSKRKSDERAYSIDT
ncbi:Gfo/Idh/MocA family protein [Runella sp. SP2]|uniref:Gfo/Idh/MocA family protein n=1 Tax=Runella sp. SP2 TaxID=2268026 RepID=UPI000F08F18C|nr:Gfo/Idh/MocA family oxidoreductase [Runella sp. SP2]AYQ31185.1 gfo/Idh/MocA family oxidoreductase [Runella sp. SP2]